MELADDERTVAWIRRGDSAPAFVVEEQRRRRNYPHRLTARIGKRLLEVSYARGRWLRLGEPPVWEVPVRLRSTFAWVRLAGAVVGAMEFEEVCIDGGWNMCFFDGMDAHSYRTYELAEVLCTAWEDVGDDVAAYGDIVEFRGAWFSPDAARGRYFSRAAKLMLDRNFEKRSLLVIKAFPFEYEGMGGPDTAHGRACEIRQRAMKRHYAKLFGVAPLPGYFGEKGWLYAIRKGLKQVIPKPGYDPEWRKH